MSRLLVDADVIRALAEILTDTGLTEIEIAEKDSRIRVVRAPAVLQAASPSVVVTQGAAASTPEVVVVADHAKHPGAVKSPMVGVAYLSPEPTAPVFVVEGQQVTAGQTLMLIEAMKTFNQIKAPRAGTVSRIVVRTATPVEFGELLMIID